MKITELALDIGVSTYSIKQFIHDFDLELSDCLYPNMEVKDDFEKFAKENSEFLQKYEADLVDEKSCDQIAKELHPFVLLRQACLLPFLSSTVLFLNRNT